MTYQLMAGGAYDQPPFSGAIAEYRKLNGIVDTKTPSDGVISVVATASQSVGARVPILQRPETLRMRFCHMLERFANRQIRNS